MFDWIDDHDARGLRGASTRAPNWVDLEQDDQKSLWDRTPLDSFQVVEKGKRSRGPYRMHLHWKPIDRMEGHLEEC